MAQAIEAGDRVGAPIRVLAVTPGKDGRTAMPFIERQIASLRRLGIDVRTFCLESRTGWRDLLRAARAFRRTVEEVRPHIVHAHYGTMTAFFAAITSCAPLVITFRGSDLNMARDVSGLRARAGYWLSQLAALRACRIVCVSPQLRDRLLWRRDRVSILTDGIDLELFVPLDRTLARRRLGLREDARIALFHYGSRPKLKGLDLFRAAIAVAESQIGAIDALELSGQVAPEQMPLYVSAADCVVVASLREGSPNMVKEAMACNVPVASVDVGDVRERLRDVWPSAVVPRDSIALGGAIAQFLKRPTHSNGRQRVLDCSEAAVAEAIHGIYRAVTNVRPPVEVPEVGEQPAA